MNRFESIICLFFALAATLCAGAPAEHGTGRCTGGYAQGDLANVGRYWYECRKGKLEPKGCLTEDQPPRRVEISGTFDTDEHRMQCVLGPDGYMTIIFKSCVQNGREHHVGDRWDDGAAFYECSKEGPNNIRVNMLGCIDHGRRIEFNDKVAKGKHLHMCNKNADGKPTMSVAGCVHDNRKYAIGDSFDSGDKWYTCTEDGAKCVGCLYNGNRMQDGDRYTENDVEYRCAVDGEDTAFVPFSCIQHQNGATIERRLGCHWVEGQAPFMYEWMCKHDDTTKTAVKVQTRCNYKVPQGEVKLEPGCLTVLGSTAVGCVRDGPGQLTIRTFPASQADNAPAGLRRC